MRLSTSAGSAEASFWTMPVTDGSANTLDTDRGGPLFDAIKKSGLRMRMGFHNFGDGDAHGIT